VRAATYRFTEDWLVPCQPGALYDVLVDVERYPTWWPQVRAVAKLDQDVALVACRSLLPYTLHLELRPARRDREAGVLDASLDGDLVGSCSWRITAHLEGSRLGFEQQVTLASTRLRRAARVGRPLLVANHAWMMRGAFRGLGGSTPR
jgi:hypothetical protein